MISPEQAKAMSTMYLQSIEREVPTTRRVLAALPQEGHSFKLGEKGRTGGQLAWHIVESDIWFAQGILDGKFAGTEEQRPVPATCAEIVSQYDALLPLLEKLKGLSGEQLAAPIDLLGMFQYPAVIYLGFLSNHCIHHRGQLSTYLRAMNARVPSIYGPSADEQYAAPASA